MTPHGDWDQLSAAQVRALNDLFRKPGGVAMARDLRGVRLTTLNSLLRWSQIQIVHPEDQERVDALTTVGITDSGMWSIGVDPNAH